MAGERKEGMASGEGAERQQGQWRVRCAGKERARGGREEWATDEGATGREWMDGWEGKGEKRRGKGAMERVYGWLGGKERAGRMARAP